MSRIGKQPVIIPDKVKVAVNGGTVNVEGPKGKVSKPFADAVVSLQPGQTTAAPVQSQFGWHVIRLEESRAPAPPAFEEVKDRVKTLVERKRLQTYLEELKKSAKIEKKI